jgi:hypothetical protein
MTQGFKEDFATKEITKAKLSRYILASIANKKLGKPELGVLEDEKIVTLEHIMPKTRTQHWVRAAANEDEYMEYVNRLGNLTLIERDKNRVVGSASFADKKSKAFTKSDISITKEICNYTEWTVNKIELRQSEFADEAVDIWTLPY